MEVIPVSVPPNRTISFNAGFAASRVATAWLARAAFTPDNDDEKAKVSEGMVIVLGPLMPAQAVGLVPMGPGMSVHLCEVAVSVASGCVK